MNREIDRVNREIDQLNRDIAQTIKEIDKKTVSNRFWLRELKRGFDRLNKEQKLKMLFR